jgi:HK97 family phage prohead protease
MSDLDRRKLAEAISGIERRTFTANLVERADGAAGRTLQGYACVVETEYDMRWYTETIAAGAFDKTLRERPDVMLLVNHAGLPLARTKTGDLRLSVDSTGLAVEADLDPDDPDVVLLASKMDRKLMDEMSFAFRVMRQEWNEDYTKRYITEVSLDKGDVSVVNYGANPSTSVSLRGAELLNTLDDLSVEEQRAAWVRLGVLLESVADGDDDNADEQTGAGERGANNTLEQRVRTAAELRQLAAASAARRPRL